MLAAAAQARLAQMTSVADAIRTVWN